MNRLIEYFLENSRLNYTILVFLVVMGVFSYIKIPKEMFPTVTLESIQVSGSYAGASADSLNNFAVTEIENQIDSIAGIQEVSSSVSSGSFRIQVELQDGVDKIEALNEVKDAVSAAKKYLPSDMTEPTVSSIQRQMSLLNVAISSEVLSKNELLEKSKKLKTSLMQISNISDVQIFGDSDLEIDIYLDHKKINMYKLDSDALISAISGLSYMYPVASIEQVGNHLYLSADNNKFDIETWKNTLLKIGDKKVYLSDIATIVIGYPTDETISRLNAKTTISLQIYKDDVGDSIQVAKNVKALLEQMREQNPNLSLDISRDSSKPVNDRIRTILSNITLGLILVGISMYILISPRLSFVIVLGIPFSFILGLLIIESLGFSLNMISMMAMLITLGIVVDDAIIVSENIQRYIDEGLEVKEAVLKGTKQMIAPVLIAALTTVFAFLPMLLISGEMGLLTRLIPIVISVLILSSLIESFLFLPLHAKHVLKKNEKMLDWSRAYDIYESILHKVIHYKKTFLAVFFITIPILSFVLVQQSRFQMFPDMDTRNVTISIKLDESTSLEQSDIVAKRYEKILLENAKKLYIKNINATIGRYTDLVGNSETIENSFTLALELEEFKEDNILQNYINPILSLSFEFGQKDKLRLEDTTTVMNKIRALVAPSIKQDNVVDYNVVSSRIGIVRTDIELKLSAEDTKELIHSIDTLKAKLATIKGVKDITDNTQLGQNEYKYSVNAYGKTLGLSDKSIASSLSSYFMDKEQANTYDNSGIIKINSQSLYKDSLEELQSFLIPVDEQYVALREVVSFKIERNFERIEKEDGKAYKKVFANVENKTISATEVLQQLEESIQSIEEKNVHVSFGGEREHSAQMATDMIKAFLVAMFLIFITLLINFPSFKSALMILSVIPYTIMGPLIGHMLLGINLNSQSMIGMLGLAGVVINDGIIMLDFLHETKNKREFFERAKQRVRPILITSITTMLGLFTLIFFPSGESVMLQPIAVSLGFGIAWGTILNLFYIPAIYATTFKIKD